MGRHPYTHIDQYRHTDTRMPSRLPCDHKMDEERGREEGRVSARMREKKKGVAAGLERGEDSRGWRREYVQGGAREIATLERDRNTHAHSHTCSKALPPGAVNVKNIHSSPSEFLHHPNHCFRRGLCHTQTHTHTQTQTQTQTQTHSHTYSETDTQQAHTPAAA